MIQIFTNTPLWVWFILAFLLKRGVSATKDNPVHLVKSLIVPFVFILWGLEKVFTRFEFPLMIIMTYLIFILMGVIFSYYLYRNRRFYLKNNVLFQTGSYIPLIVMLFNFLVKYILNVSLAVSPHLYHTFAFNIFYGLICGFTVGLFFGNILRILKVRER
jgi:hypothetical protein